MRDGDEWVETGECGLALPAILEEAGLSTSTYSGLAMGLGLDRLLMLVKRLDDIRALRSTDPRVAGQNALLRIVIRDLVRTLTRQEANQLRDAVYAALHEGSEWQWAGTSGQDNTAV